MDVGPRFPLCTLSQRIYAAGQMHEVLHATCFWLVVRINFRHDEFDAARLSSDAM